MMERRCFAAWTVIGVRRWTQIVSGFAWFTRERARALRFWNVDAVNPAAHWRRERLVVRHAGVRQPMSEEHPPPCCIAAPMPSSATRGRRHRSCRRRRRRRRRRPASMYPRGCSRNKHSYCEFRSRRALQKKTMPRSGTVCGVGTSAISRVMYSMRCTSTMPTLEEPSAERLVLKCFDDTPGADVYQERLRTDLPFPVQVY